MKVWDLKVKEGEEEKSAPVIADLRGHTWAVYGAAFNPAMDGDRSTSMRFASASGVRPSDIRTMRH